MSRTAMLMAASKSILAMRNNEPEQQPKPEADEAKKAAEEKVRGELGRVMPEYGKKEGQGGEMAHNILTNIVNAPGYDAIPDLVKRKIFSKVLTASHQVAAVQAMPMEKRLGYLQSISEKVAQELTPGEAQ